MKKKLVKILVALLIISAIALFAFAYSRMSQKEKPQEIEEVKELDMIETKEFDYKLYDNKSDLYQEKFNKLKEELTKEEINEEEYAKTIAELFVVDFYSLEDKKTSSDVGGLDFIYDKIKENFILKATDTIYKNIESNVYGDRKQELPKITATEVKEAKEIKIELGEIKDEKGYTVTVGITYKKELGYPKTVTLSLIHQESKIVIVEVK